MTNLNTDTKLLTMFVTGIQLTWKKGNFKILSEPFREIGGRGTLRGDFEEDMEGGLG